MKPGSTDEPPLILKVMQSPTHVFCKEQMIILQWLGIYVV